MNTRQFIAVLFLALGIAGSVVAWVLWPDERAESQAVVDPVAVSPVLQQLAPGTTLHTVDVVYRRHGHDTPPSEGPQTQRSESWATFDGQGLLADWRQETRAVEGTLLGTAGLEGNDLVSYDAAGVERDRIDDFRLGLTVDSLKARIAEATTSSAAALAAQPDAPKTTLAGTSVLVLQDRRQFSRPTAIGEGYSIPHVADLNPVEEIRRQYVLPGEFRSMKSEVVIIGEDGTETVVESTEHQVLEVIAVTP